MKKLGIHARIILTAFFLIFSATLALDFAGVHITSQFMHKRFEDRITFLAKYLALNSEVGVLIGDRSGLKSLALNLLGEEDVARVIILDNQNNILVDLSREVPGQISMVETPVLFKQQKNENMMIFSERITPFGKRVIPGAEHIGKVKIYFSTHGIDQLMNKITHKFIWISSALTILAGLIFYFISRSITVDVSKLVSTAKQVGRGDIGLRAQVGRIPETKELSLAFNAMLDSLALSRQALHRVNQEMIQQKTLAEVGKFSLMVAHEVKNPIGIIKSSLDILKKDLKISSENMLVSYIEDEIKRLDRMIEDFLLFSRPAKPKMQSHDLNGLLSDIISRFQLQHFISDVDIANNISEQSCITLADSDLITRAFLNILKNAKEANSESGMIGVFSERKNNKWIASIEDEGMGIDTGNLTKIFDPFFTTRSKGTGLGLAFSNQVIRAHGGKLSAENRKEGGARFLVELPIKEA